MNNNRTSFILTSILLDLSSKLTISAEPCLHASSSEFLKNKNRFHKLKEKTEYLNKTLNKINIYLQYLHQFPYVKAI